MLTTPDTSHVLYDSVYEPSEDSFLLLDTLASEADYLTTRFRGFPPLVLEVGSGSGVALSFVAMHSTSILGQNGVLVMGLDINDRACKATEQTLRCNALDAHGLALGCNQSDLASVVRDHTVDVLIFNPPYVPSETVPPSFDESQIARSESEEQNRLLTLATDGGRLGMEITNKLLGQVPRMLSKMKGVAYVLLCAQNKPEDVKNRLRAWGEEWSVDTVGRSGSKGGWERLHIIRIART